MRKTDSGRRRMDEVMRRLSDGQNGVTSSVDEALGKIRVMERMDGVA